ncbi:MAG: DUF2087 domain-containing protein [Pseudomonadota bacterium]
MTRTPLPLYHDDLSSFSRTLAKELGPNAPSHLTLMNMLARAAGFENVQHMRAAEAASRRLARQEPPAPVDARRVERALQHFDAEGRLKQWPSKRQSQTLALWAIWARLPAKAPMSEPELNAKLNAAHSFEDPATLRRAMISEGLLTREVDGSVYHRLEQRPPAEALALAQAIAGR